MASLPFTVSIAWNAQASPALPSRCPWLNEPHISARSSAATRELSLGSSPEPPAVARSAVSATGELAPDGPRPLGAVIAAATAAAAAAAAAVEEDVARAVRRHLAWRVKRSAAHLWPES